jgi:hypothetical protein
MHFPCEVPGNVQFTSSPSMNAGEMTSFALSSEIWLSRHEFTFFWSGSSFDECGQRQLRGNRSAKTVLSALQAPE